MLVTFLVYPVGANAQSFTILDKANSAKLTGTYIEFDPSVQTFEDAFNSYQDKKNYTEHSKLKRKYSKKPIWYAFSVKNSFDEKLERIIQFPFGCTEQMELYIFNKDGKYQKVSINHKVPISERKYNIRRLSAGLNFEPQEEKFIIAKLHSYHQLSANFDIYSTKKAYKYESDYKVISVLYVGVALGLFLYNLFIGVNSGKKAIYSYISLLFTLSTMIMIIADIPAYFGIVVPEFLHKTLPFHRSMTIFVLILFTTQFLNTKKYLPKTNTLLMVFGTWSLVIGACSYFDSTYHFVNVVIKNLMTVNIIMIICVSVYISVKTKSRPAMIFTLATTFLFISGLIYLLTWSFGVIPRNFFTANIILLGSALDMIFFSLAIADNFKSIISKELESRQRMEKELVNLNQFLEKKVKEKTNQLLTSKKRAALGEMATSVAHEMNSPLSAVFNSLQYQSMLLKKHNPDFDKIKLLNEKNIRIVNEVFGITHKLKAFGESYGDIAKETVDIDAMIKDSIKRSQCNMYYTEEKGIFLETYKAHLYNVLSAIFCVSKQINETNFVSVSHEADNLVVEITGSNKTVPEWIANYIEIPFYDQSGEVKGSGLELSLAKDAIEAMGGKIIVSHGEDFVFKIYIPTKEDNLRNVA